MSTGSARPRRAAASVGLTPALPRHSHAGHGEGVAPHRPYAMAGGFGALVGDAALPSTTRPTDVPWVDVGQVDVWQADVRDVKVDVAGARSAPLRASSSASANDGANGQLV